MTPEEADKKQDWAGMDGAIAFHLIERHADDWGEAGEMMNAWARANSPAWHDAPTCAGLWLCTNGSGRPMDWDVIATKWPLQNGLISERFPERWFGPIPMEKEA